MICFYKMSEILHLYAYCSNNPINYVDPSGHYRYSSIKYYKSYKRQKYKDRIDIYLSKNLLNSIFDGVTSIGFLYAGTKVMNFVSKSFKYIVGMSVYGIGNAAISYYKGRGIIRAITIKLGRARYKHWTGEYRYITYYVRTVRH